MPCATWRRHRRRAWQPAAPGVGGDLRARLRRPLIAPLTQPPLPCLLLSSAPALPALFSPLTPRSNHLLPSPAPIAGRPGPVTAPVPQRRRPGSGQSVPSPAGKGCPPARARAAAVEGV